MNIFHEIKECKKTGKPIIIVVGPINAGKSSFINSLCGEQLARSSILRETENVELIETANYYILNTPGFERDSDTAFRTALGLIYHSDLIIYVIDSGHEIMQNEIDDFKKVYEQVNINKENIIPQEIVVCMTKYDIMESTDVQEIITKFRDRVPEVDFYRYSSHCVLASKLCGKGATITTEDRNIINEMMRIQRTSGINSILAEKNLDSYTFKFNADIHLKQFYGDWDYFGTFVEGFYQNNTMRKINYVSEILNRIKFEERYFDHYYRALELLQQLTPFGGPCESIFASIRARIPKKVASLKWITVLFNMFDAKKLTMIVIDALQIILKELNRTPTHTISMDNPHLDDVLSLITFALSNARQLPESLILKLLRAIYCPSEELEVKFFGENEALHCYICDREINLLMDSNIKHFHVYDEPIARRGGITEDIHVQINKRLNLKHANSTCSIRPIINLVAGQYVGHFAMKLRLCVMPPEVLRVALTPRSVPIGLFSSQISTALTYFATSGEYDGSILYTDLFADENLPKCHAGLSITLFDAIHSQVDELFVKKS